jgi:hypothetical protein
VVVLGEERMLAERLRLRSILEKMSDSLSLRLLIQVRLMLCVGRNHVELWFQW